jgi:hypothetical protein
MGVSIERPPLAEFWAVQHGKNCPKCGRYNRADELQPRIMNSGHPHMEYLQWLCRHCGGEVVATETLEASR